MMSKYLSLVLVITLTAALATPARADSLKTIGVEAVVAVVAVTTAFVVVVVLVAVHYSKKRSITGCVVPAGNGMTVTDEKDRRVYTLSGNTNTLGVKPGERMKLQGQKIKPKGPDKTLGWEATKTAKDLGVCQP